MEAELQFITTERPVAGRFSFADTPSLCRALRSGEEEAFRWLHQQWNSRLFRYCFAIAAGDENLAGEITQATYLRVLRHVGQLPNEDALWKWMARAASNAATDIHRGRRRYDGALARFSDWCASWFSTCRTDGPVAEMGTLPAALDAVLAQLEEADRKLIEGRYFEQVPLAEMAARENTTTRAIEGRLARLRGRLKKLIQAELKKLEALDETP